MLAARGEKYSVQDECVVMLLSTIVVDKDRDSKQKEAFGASFFYFIRIFCTVVPVSVSTQRK